MSKKDKKEEYIEESELYISIKKSCIDIANVFPPKRVITAMPAILIPIEEFNRVWEWLKEGYTGHPIFQYKGIKKRHFVLYRVAVMARTKT